VQKFELLLVCGQKVYRSDDDDVDEDDDDDKLDINTSDSCLDCWLRDGDGGGGDGVVVLLEFWLVVNVMFSWGVASVDVSCLRLDVRFRTISSSFRNVHVCANKNKIVCF